MSKAYIETLQSFLLNYNKKYHTLSKGFGLDEFHPEFMEFKSKILFLFKTMIENKPECTTLLEEFLDIKAMVELLEDLLLHFANEKKIAKDLGSFDNFSYHL
mmetsp:Transcript_10430/g.8961  ORF Transcript_10430/g.8961 Transcript_10430/m.8961 type:complete len:102 (+) Transcript_10430:449-754(+)